MKIKVAGNWNREIPGNFLIVSRVSDTWHCFLSKTTSFHFHCQLLLPQRRAFPLLRRVEPQSLVPASFFSIQHHSHLHSSCQIMMSFSNKKTTLCNSFRLHTNTLWFNAHVIFVQYNNIKWWFFFLSFIELWIITGYFTVGCFIKDLELAKVPKSSSKGVMLNEDEDAKVEGTGSGFIWDKFDHIVRKANIRMGNLFAPLGFYSSSLSHFTVDWWSIFCFKFTKIVSYRTNYYLQVARCHNGVFNSMKIEIWKTVSLCLKFLLSLSK